MCWRRRVYSFLHGLRERGGFATRGPPSGKGCKQKLNKEKSEADNQRSRKAEKQEKRKNRDAEKQRKAKAEESKSTKKNNKKKLKQGRAASKHFTKKQKSEADNQ